MAKRAFASVTDRRSSACRPRAILAAALFAMLASGVTGALAQSSSSTPSAPQIDEERLLITVGPDGRDLRFAGDFLEGAAEQVRAALDAHPEITRIHFTSDGGFVDESRAVGDLIAARGLVTYVPDYCVSACTLAFVRGRERLVMEGARLGFHAPFETDDDGREVQVDGTEEEQAYLAAGVEPDFARQALGTPSAQLWVPSPERLVQARVATAVVDGRRLPDSTLDDEPTFAGARTAALRNVAVLQVIEAVAPDLVDEVALWYLEGYRRGRSEGEAAAGLRARANRLARVALAGADGETVRGRGQVVLAALDREETDLGRGATGPSPITADASLVGSPSRAVPQPSRLEDAGGATLRALRLLRPAPPERRSLEAFAVVHER